MTDIIKLAREAGMKASIGKTDKQGNYHPNVNALFSSVPIEWLERFAELVAAPLKAENEALKADAERLDWLNLAGNHYAFHLSGTWYSRKDHGSPYKKHSNIRAAIDAARAKEQT
jgi:hypothetical protein